MEENKKKKEKGKRSRRSGLIAVIIVLIILAVVVACADFITDLIWFGEVGYTSVFLTELFTKIKIGIPVAVITAGISVFILSALKNNFLKKNNFSLDSEDDKRSVRRVRNVLSVILGVFLAVVTVSKLWFQMLEFFNYSSFGVKDPLFNNDVGFYMFRYQFLSGLADSALLIIAAFLVATVLFHSVLVGIARPADAGETEERESSGINVDPNDPLGSIFRGISGKAGEVREGAAKSGFVRKAKAVLSVALKKSSYSACCCSWRLQPSCT